MFWSSFDWFGSCMNNYFVLCMWACVQLYCNISGAVSCYNVYDVNVVSCTVCCVTHTHTYTHTCTHRHTHTHTQTHKHTHTHTAAFTPAAATSVMLTADSMPSSCCSSHCQPCKHYSWSGLRWRPHNCSRGSRPVNASKYSHCCLTCP